MSKFLTRDKIKTLENKFEPSKEGFRVELGNYRILELTHEDISLIADFDKFRYSRTYNDWLNDYFSIRD